MVSTLFLVTGAGNPVKFKSFGYKELIQSRSRMSCRSMRETDGGRMMGHQWGKNYGAKDSLTKTLPFPEVRNTDGCQTTACDSWAPRRLDQSGQGAKEAGERGESPAGCAGAADPSPADPGTKNNGREPLVQTVGVGSGGKSAFSARGLSNCAAMSISFGE